MIKTDYIIIYAKIEPWINVAWVNVISCPLLQSEVSQKLKSKQEALLNRIAKLEKAVT